MNNDIFREKKPFSGRYLVFKPCVTTNDDWVSRDHNN
jgi:hypothetical protein